MNRKGFALLEIIIVVAIVALIGGGGLYVKYFENQQATLQTDNDAIKQATEVQQQSQVEVTQENNIIDQLGKITTTTPKIVATTTVAIISPDQTDVNWSDTKKLINRCEVRGFEYGGGCDGGPVVEVFMKNGQHLNVSGVPSIDDLNAAVVAGSSTCGPIPADGRIIVDCAP